jgi:phosphoenolpyruvate synthase/pyruvate phosphate dikinase
VARFLVSCSPYTHAIDACVIFTRALNNPPPTTPLEQNKTKLGGKGANLCEMARLGVNIPPGFTITTDVCQEFYRVGGRLPDGLMDEARAALAQVEAEMGKKFADPNNTLLLSVRSGAALSMPGMMDTVLNLGLNDEIVEGLAKQAGNERFALDCYRRLLQMFGDVVLGIPHDEFEHEIVALKREAGVKFDCELDAGHLRQLVAAYKAVYKRNNMVLPQDPWEQLRMGACLRAACSVFCCLLLPPNLFPPPTPLQSLTPRPLNQPPTLTNQTPNPNQTNQKP